MERPGPPRALGRRHHFARKGEHSLRQRQHTCLQPARLRHQARPAPQQDKKPDGHPLGADRLPCRLARRLLSAPSQHNVGSGRHLQKIFLAYQTQTRIREARQRQEACPRDRQEEEHGGFQPHPQLPLPARLHRKGNEDPRLRLQAQRQDVSLRAHGLPQHRPRQRDRRQPRDPRLFRS